MGSGPLEYLTNRRLTLATKRLQDPTESIASLAPVLATHPKVRSVQLSSDIEVLHAITCALAALSNKDGSLLECGSCRTYARPILLT